VHRAGALADLGHRAGHQRAGARLGQATADLVAGLADEGRQIVPQQIGI